MAAICLVLGTIVAAQDTDVHIKPREKPAPEAPKDPKTGASTGPVEKTHGKAIQVDVNVVLVNVTVTDDFNRIVTGLEKENFAIAENGQPQEILNFSSEDAPLSLGVIFDISGSMSDKILKSREAVIEFFKTANPQDEFFLISFSDRPRLVADFTSSVEDVQNKIVFEVPQGRTALLDAIYMGVAKMKEAHNPKKALLIISDGGDNHSRYTENEIKSIVKEADVQIYAIGVFGGGGGTPEELGGPQMLGSVTEVTGGRLFTLNSTAELADVATKIGIELRNQYVLGYKPTNRVRDGHWRKIKVKLVPPKGLPHLNVYSKTGYYAPSQ
jgi:Ca-activated chloride channel family protein